MHLLHTTDRYAAPAMQLNPPAASSPHKSVAALAGCWASDELHARLREPVVPVLPAWPALVRVFAMLAASRYAAPSSCQAAAAVPRSRIAAVPAHEGLGERGRPHARQQARQPTEAGAAVPQVPRAHQEGRRRACRTYIMPLRVLPGVRGPLPPLPLQRAAARAPAPHPVPCRRALAGAVQQLDARRTTSSAGHAGCTCPPPWLLAQWSCWRSGGAHAQHHRRACHWLCALGQASGHTLPHNKSLSPMPMYNGCHLTSYETHSIRSHSCSRARAFARTGLHAAAHCLLAACRQHGHGVVRA